MSNSDSFIQEVTEEVRRDRLFGLMRRYGWIAVLAVLLVVGGTGWREYNKAATRSAAQAFGDSLIAAFDHDTPEARLAALNDIPPGTPGARVTLAFTRASELIAAGQTTQAAEALEALATDPDVPAIYRQIAAFRAAVLQQDLPAPDRRARFESLAEAGGLMRLLSEEQIALIELESGETAAALSRAGRILADAEATAGLQRRMTQLIVALGGEVPDISGAAGAGRAQE